MLHLSCFRGRLHAVIHRKSTRIGDADERHQKIRGARTWGTTGGAAGSWDMCRICALEHEASHFQTRHRGGGNSKKQRHVGFIDHWHWRWSLEPVRRARRKTSSLLVAKMMLAIITDSSMDTAGSYLRQDASCSGGMCLRWTVVFTRRLRGGRVLCHALRLVKLLDVRRKELGMPKERRDLRFIRPRLGHLKRN